MCHLGLVTCSCTQLIVDIQELGQVIKSSDGFYATLSLPNERIPDALLGERIPPLEMYLYCTLIIYQ